MATIKPFKALRPETPFAKQVASRPYDVLNSTEAKVEAQGNPASFLHITKSEIDLGNLTDIHSSAVYERAKENLTAFISRGILYKETRDCFYIYRLIMDGRAQTGLVAASSLDDYDNGIIKKHELTRPEKELDRINHIKHTGAQTGNVFLAYRQVEEIDGIINQWKSTKSPAYDFIADDNIKHTIWIISDSVINKKITDLFETKVPYTYIADGHHRAASAAKVRGEIKDLTADHPANFFLTTLFPANELRILDYNRVVKDLNGLAKDAFLNLLKENFLIASNGSEPYAPTAPREFGLYINGEWLRLKAFGTESRNNDPIASLDVSILSDLVLDKLLGIKDQRTDKRIDFVGGIRGLAALEERVKSGEMAAAFSIYPVSMDQLFAVADSGNIMPPKSTWFEPKLRDGLLTHLIY